VSHGDSGANELRCQSCFADALAWRSFGWMTIAIIAGALIVFVIVGAIANRVVSH